MLTRTAVNESFEFCSQSEVKFAPLRRQAKLHSRSELHCRRQLHLPERANLVVESAFETNDRFNMLSLREHIKQNGAFNCVILMKVGQ